MGMIDDLGRLKKVIDASRPKNHIDYILSTRCPISTKEGVRVLYKGNWYLIANWVMVYEVRASFYEQVTVSSPLWNPLWLPIIENEGLAREILLYIDNQPDSGLVLSDEAREWAKKE